MKTPGFTCRDCKRRTVGCHSHCKDYLNAKADYERDKLEVRKAKEAYGNYVGYRAAKKAKAARAH